MALRAHEKSGMANATPAIPLPPPMPRIIIEECDFDSHVLGFIIEEFNFISHVLRLIMEELVFLICTSSVLSDSTGMISKIFAFSLSCV